MSSLFNDDVAEDDIAENGLEEGKEAGGGDGDNETKVKRPAWLKQKKGKIIGGVLGKVCSSQFTGGGKKVKKASKPAPKAAALIKTNVEDSPSVSVERKSKSKSERKQRLDEDQAESADESDADTNDLNDKSSGDESTTQKSNPEDDDQVSDSIGKF